MSSRDLRAARAARSARSTSPSKSRATTLKNGTQTRSLQTFQVSTDDLASERTTREDRQHTLPSVSRKKSQASSAESRKSTIDDFHFEYDDDRQRYERTATVSADEANNDDFVMFRRDNLSQDSYRISDSRDSSVDRLETRTKEDFEAELIGGEPLDEAKLIQKLEQEQQLQESRQMEDQDTGDAGGQLWLNDDHPMNGEDVHIVKAEWDLPESCLQTEVEKVVSIETTRIVETVETTRFTPTTETYQRQKRLSRENAVRVVDEDLTSSLAEMENFTVETAYVPEPEFTVPISTSIDENETDNGVISNESEIKSFVESIIDEAMKKFAEEVKDLASDEETDIAEDSTISLTDESESVFPATVDSDSPVKEITQQSEKVAPEDKSDDDLIVANYRRKSETEKELEEENEPDVVGQNSEDTAESQITVVEMATSDVHLESSTEEPLDTVTDIALEETTQQAPSNVASPSQEIAQTKELSKDTNTDDVLSAVVCPDTDVPACAEDDQQHAETVATEIDTSPLEKISCEKEEQERPDTATVDSTEVSKETEQPEPEETVEVAVRPQSTAAVETSEDIPYVLHKRHIVSSTEKTAADIRFYATLPIRHHASRSRSLSPGHKKTAILTSEQKRAQMTKVKASLVSMAAEMAAQRSRSPKSPIGGVSAATKRVFDFVVCSRLPPRDSFSSRDDTFSPPGERDIMLTSQEKKVSDTEKSTAHESEAEPTLDSNLDGIVEKTVDQMTERERDQMEKASASDTLQTIAGSPSCEIETLLTDVALSTDEIEETDEVGRIRRAEGLESEFVSECKTLGDEAAMAEVGDEVNQTLSERALHDVAEDNGRLASGKLRDDSGSPPSRDLEEANSRSGTTPMEGVTLSESTVSPPDNESSKVTAESHDEKPQSAYIETKSGDVAEIELRETTEQVGGPQVRDSISLSAVDQSLNGAVIQSDEAALDYLQHETDATAVGGIINGAELAEVEQRLLLELQANDLTVPGDNISSSSHSLNDQLDAEVLQSCSTVPPAVDAACRLSESSVDGPATCGFGRNVHLLDWLEEQAQLRGVTMSPHGAEGHADAVISDEDDVEHAVFEDNLQDIFAALEAEVMANPFLVPITPQTSDMCVNPVTSERLSFEDDSSLGVLEASGGAAVDSSYAVDTHHKEVVALIDDQSKNTSALGIADTEGNIRRSQLSLSISSEGDVVVEHVNDLTDPLEVLEIESRALPHARMQDLKPVCLLSDSDSFSDECREEEKLQDVGDVLDRLDEGRRLSISDLGDDENLIPTEGTGPAFR